MESGNGRRSAKTIRQRLEDPLDLDNPIVNDKYDDKYLHAVSGGPWTIFGQYLTVRLWTPSFTTDQDFPTSLLVWIRLPRLSEGMYTRSLLKFIARAIGRVAKIDCNNDNKCGRFEHSSDACLHRSEKKETIEGVTVENLDKDTTAQ
ncbi:hypothetical protein Gotri_011648 [Gossypium trilobum]|uniref:DUF4283 domain-containing protein n=1 Tax=Gossypium trilobum TaxID=34281 RepID=A0A7J9EUG9_9ROSI|nr:hypothetical protein [Gossypium trilobum]